MIQRGIIARPLPQPHPIPIHNRKSLNMNQRKPKPRHRISRVTTRQGDGGESQLADVDILMHDSYV